MNMTKLLIHSLLVTLPIQIYCMESDTRKQELALFNEFQINANIPNNWIEICNSKGKEYNKALGKTHQIAENFSRKDNPLFRNFPRLQEQLPYVALGNFPTTFTLLLATSFETKTAIYIKRDDFTGGPDIYGGNKVRKLEFLLGQAVADGFHSVMTFGCVASNHALATAVHASRLGMKAVCMLKHQPFSHVVQHNLLMQLNKGSDIHYNANNDTRKLEALLTWWKYYKEGNPPYIIPTGGSNKIGAIGFVNAAFELKEQIDNGMMPKPTHIYVPCGSCATTAGLLLGFKAAKLDVHIVAVATEPEDETYQFAPTIDKLFKETNRYLHTLDSSFPECSYSDKDLTINLGFHGPDYGEFTPEGMDAVKQMQKLEGIKLEGTYTGKAFAALLDAVKKNPNQIPLFWNTYCGLDMSADLKNRDYTQLPACLHKYFYENNIQPLDTDKPIHS